MNEETKKQLIDAGLIFEDEETGEESILLIPNGKNVPDNAVAVALSSLVKTEEINVLGVFKTTDEDEANLFRTNVRLLRNGKIKLARFKQMFPDLADEQISKCLTVRAKAKNSEGSTNKDDSTKKDETS